MGVAVGDLHHQRPAQRGGGPADQRLRLVLAQKIGLTQGESVVRFLPLSALNGDMVVERVVAVRAVLLATLPLAAALDALR